MDPDNGRSRKGVARRGQWGFLINVDQACSQYLPSLFGGFREKEEKMIGSGTEAEVGIPEMGLEKSGKGVRPLVGQTVGDPLGNVNFDRYEGEIPAIPESAKDFPRDILRKIPVVSLARRMMRRSGNTGFLLVSWHGVSSGSSGSGIKKCFLLWNDVSGLKSVFFHHDK